MLHVKSSVQRRLFVALLAFAVMIFARVGSAQHTTNAESAQPARRLYADAYILGGFNPLSGGLILGVHHQWNHAHHPNVLLDNRREQAGVEININPAYTALSPYVEWTPLQILVLRAQVDVFGYYGIFGAILRFPDKTSAFGDNIRNDRWTDSRAGVVTRIVGQATLQAQVGPVIVRNTFEVNAFALHGDEEHWIDLQRDLLLARRDLVLSNDAQLLIEPYRRADGRGLFVGGYHHIAYAQNSGYRRQRVGVMGEWIFRENLGRMQKPRFVLLSAYHLEDRNREGGFYACAAFGGEFNL